jgi:outer membrane protein TolC
MLVMSCLNAAWAAPSSRKGEDRAETAISERVVASDVGDNAAVASLSLEDCIEIALAAHPSLRQARGVTQEQEAHLESLRANDRAKLSAGVSHGYSRSSSSGSDNSYSAGLSGSKMLYDGGKNRISRTAQGIAIRQAGEGETNTALSIICDVENACYKLLLAQKNLEVAQDQLRNLGDHLRMAQGYYEVGARPRIDVTRAEVDVANARVEMLKAEADVRLSYENLLVSMGSVNLKPFVLSTTLDAPTVSTDVENATQVALSTRSDYRRAQLEVEAARVRIRSAARSNAPTFTASFGGQYSGRDFPLQDNANVGLRVDFPVFDGGERDASTAAARAQLAQAEASLEGLTQSIVYEVRQATVDLENARQRVQSAEEAVQYANENLKLAQGRYSTGVGSPIEVSDAVSTLSKALFTRYQTLYDALVAAVALEKATGGAIR